MVLFIVLRLTLPFVCFVLFVCDPQPHFSRGDNSRKRTYGGHPLPPRPLVTPGPCVSVCSLSPHTFVLNASCIRSVPSPVLLSYTYIESIESLVCFPVLHIYSNPTEKNPSTYFKPHKQTMLVHYLNKRNN